MLAPEVWNIGNEEVRRTKHATKLKECGLPEIERLLRGSLLNHSVTFTLAGCSELPSEMRNIFQLDYEYYLAYNVPVTEFFDISFVELFLKKGEITAASNGMDTNVENTFALLPDNRLILKLTEDTYTRLGMDGERIKHWNGDQYVVQLNLNDKSMVTGKLYERFRKRLEDVRLKFDVLISWEPRDATICPSSLASYLCRKSYKVVLCKSKYSSYSQYEEKVQSPFIEDDSEEFLFWFGTHLLKTNPNFQDESKMEESVQTNITTHKWTGFLTVKQINSVWSCIKDYLKSGKLMSKNWLCMYVSGFRDSPVPLNMSSKYVKKCDDYFIIFCSVDKYAMYPFLYVGKRASF